MPNLSSNNIELQAQFSKINYPGFSSDVMQILTTSKNVSLTNLLPNENVYNTNENNLDSENEGIIVFEDIEENFHNYILNK